MFHSLCHVPTYRGLRSECSVYEGRNTKLHNSVSCFTSKPLGFDLWRIEVPAETFLGLLSIFPENFIRIHS